MPNRVLREGFLDSEPVHALSDAGECFFHRLLLAADDAGRMDGRVEILRARLFPLDLSRRASDVEKTLAESVGQGLVIPYVWKSQRFLQITKWQRCSPCVTSRFPWRDGSFRIEYVKAETRDGQKDFVATSIPSARDNDGISTVIPPMYGDVDVDECVNEQEQGASPTAPPAPKRGREAQGARLPTDWELPDDWAAWARAERPDLNIQKVAATFADHWHAKAGKDARKTDWKATWRNWVRGERLTPANAAPPPSATPKGLPKPETPEQKRAAREAAERQLREYERMSRGEA